MTWTFQPFPVGGGTLIQAPHLTNGQTFYGPTLSFTGNQFPRVIATLTDASAGTSISHTVTLPSYAAGDRIVIINGRSGSPGESCSITGWTTTNGERVAIHDRVMDGTEGSSVSLDISTSASACWTIYVLAAGSFDTLQVVEVTTVAVVATTTPDPPSETASWGADNNLFFAAWGGIVDETVSVYPLDHGRLNVSSTGGSISSVGACYQTSTGATFDPGTFTTSAGGNKGTLTAVVRGYSAAGGTTVEPPLYTNTQTFYGPTLSFPGDQYPRIDATVTLSTEPAFGGTSDIDIGSFAAGDRLVVILAGKNNSSPVTPPAGWTVVADTSASGDTTSILYRDMDGSESSTITVTTDTSSQTSGITLRIHAGSFDSAVAPEASITTPRVTSTTPDPPSLSPSWGAANNLWIAGYTTNENSSVSISAYPYVDFNVYNDLVFDNDAGQLAIAAKWSTAATENPGTFTINLSRAHQPFTIAVKGYSATVEPPLYTNTQSFFSPTILRTLKPPVHTNNQTFNTQTLNVRVTPTLVTNTQSFFSASIRSVVLPNLLGSSTTIFNPTVTLATTISPNIHTNTQGFFSAAIRITLQPGLHSDGESFFSPSVRVGINPSAYTNTNVFQTASLSITLKPTLHSDADVFGNATVVISGLNKNPILYVNTNEFYGPSVNRSLFATNHVNNQTHYTHSLGRTVLPTNYVDPDTINSQSIVRTLKPTNYVDSDTFYTQSIGRTVNPTNYTDPDTFYTQSIGRIFSPTNLVNVQSHYTQSISRTLFPGLLADDDTFYGHVISIAALNLSASLHLNVSVFYGLSLRLTFTPSIHANESLFPTHNLYNDLGQIWIEETNPSSPVWGEVGNPADPSWSAIGNPSSPAWSNVNDVISNWTEIPNGSSVTWSEND